MKTLKSILAITSLLIASAPARAEPRPIATGQVQVKQTVRQPIYTITINVAGRITKAINYVHRNGSTTIDFQGTPLMPAARGEAKVESKQGYTKVTTQRRRGHGELRQKRYGGKVEEIDGNTNCCNAASTP